MLSTAWSFWFNHAIILSTVACNVVEGKNVVLSWQYFVTWAKMRSLLMCQLQIDTHLIFFQLLTLDVSLEGNNKVCRHM